MGGPSGKPKNGDYLKNEDYLKIKTPNMKINKKNYKPKMGMTQKMKRNQVIYIKYCAIPHITLFGVCLQLK